jgi:hypothetical protein
MKKSLYYDGQFMGHSEKDTINTAIDDLGIDIQFEELNINLFTYEPAEKICNIAYFKAIREWWVIDENNNKIFKVDNPEYVERYRRKAYEMGYLCLS